MIQANQLLLSCLRETPKASKISRLQGFSEKDWEEILAVAERYGVTPILFHARTPFFSELNMPVKIREKMRRAYYISAGRNMRIYRQLFKIIDLFNQKELAVIILKGAHLAEFIYGNPALRPMGDIDLLVRKNDLPLVHEILVQDGYVSEDKQQGSSLVHLAPYEKEGCVRIEVHYHLLEPPFSERCDAAGLWDRARTVSFQDTKVLTLCPEDLMLHLAAHTCMVHGFDNGLVPYIDVRQVMAHYQGELDWVQLWQRAQAWGLDRSVYLVLALTEKLLGVVMPEEVYVKMNPGPEAINAVSAAESLIYETNTGVTKFIARLFTGRGWRIKLKILLARTFPPKETMSVPNPASGNISRLTLYRLYGLRFISLLKKHGKTVWALLTGSPETVLALDHENKKNRLRDWLSQSSKP